MPQRNQTRQSVRIVEVTDGDSGQRLDNFLHALVRDAPRSLVYKIIRTGQVRINGKRCRPTHRLKTGDRVRVPPIHASMYGPRSVPDWAREQVRDGLLFENDSIVVINKPAGMAVHGGSGIAWGLIDVIRDLKPAADIELAHRLDRETSGCLLLGKGKAAARALQNQFRDRVAVKSYLAMLDGCLADSPVRVDAPLLRSERGGERISVVDRQGKPAVSVFKILEHFRVGSFVEVSIETGRTHQIRAHAAHLGHAVAGDTRYGTSGQAAAWRDRGLRRLFLHAHALTVLDPQGEPLSFSCPLPGELHSVLDQLQAEWGSTDRSAG